jgi:CBS domain-containing protein
MVAIVMDWGASAHPRRGQDHRLVGLVSYRAVMRFLCSGGSIKDTPVSRIMKTEVTTVGLETSTVEAIELMQRFRIGCLPVVQDDHLVGIVTEEDFTAIAARLLQQQLGGAGPDEA